MKRILNRNLLLLIVVTVVVLWLPRVHAASIENHLLVFPFIATQKTPEPQKWFGRAIRDAFVVASYSLDKLVFLNEEELRALKRKYALSNTQIEPNKVKYGKIADHYNIAVCYGTYSIKDKSVIISAYVISGKGKEPILLQLTGHKDKLSRLFPQIINRVITTLELTQDQASQDLLKTLPGTDYWTILNRYTQALDSLRFRPKLPQDYRRAVNLLNQVIKQEPTHLGARAYRASSRLAIMLSVKNNFSKKVLSQVDIDLNYLFNHLPNHPLSHNAMIEFLITKKRYEKAIELGSNYIKIFPANHRQYFLLGRLLRLTNQVSKAEKILKQGLDRQGTDYQRKPYYKELAKLLLKHNDHVAEQYLAAAIQLEATNYNLHYLRATALYRLKRFMEAIKAIGQAKQIKKSNELLAFEGDIAKAAAKQYYEKKDYDNAFNFASIALNIDNEDFNINLLLSKILRKKNLDHEARLQLDRTNSLILRGKNNHYLLVGNEYITQGFRLDGATAYSNYIDNNPTAPEIEKLKRLIRNLRGENE